MLFILDPYYNVPLEKVNSILTDKKNYIKRLSNWSPDFIVSFVCYYFIIIIAVVVINAACKNTL